MENFSYMICGLVRVCLTNFVPLPLLSTASFPNTVATMAQPLECSDMQSPKDAIKFCGFMERRTMYVHVAVT